MSSDKRLFFFSILTIFVLTFSLATPFAARADEGTPPVEIPTESGVPTEEAPAENPATAETPAEPEPVSLPEILEQAPAETEVVVINTEGTIEPLVTQAAAEIISASDPVWCPDGQIPGGAGCTPNQVTFTDLVAYLTANPATGPGIIYFQEGLYDESVDSETSLTLDHSAAPFTGLTNLTLEGGWNLGTNTKVVNGTTTFDIPISLTGWTGNLTLRDLILAGANSDTASLTAITTGNLTLENVDASDNPSLSGAGAYLNTCVSVGGTCTGAGNISVTDGQFNTNAGGSGLFINPGGNLTMTNVQANDNGYYGADIVDHTAAGNVNLTNSDFNDNDDRGLSVITNGTVTLHDVQANANRSGAYIDAIGNVTISGTAPNVFTSTFNSNTWTGLDVRSAGNISINNTEISQNGTYGAYLDARNGTGGITVEDSYLSSNGETGLKGMTNQGQIALNNVEINGDNDSDRGAWLKTFSGGTVLVEDSLFENSLGNGLEVISSGNVNLVDTEASRNGENGARIYSTYAYACFGPRGINVTLDGGIFQDNDRYGLYVSPGPDGTLAFLSAPTYGPPANGLGNYYLDKTDNCQSGPCDDPKPSPTPKPSVTPTPSVTPDPKPTEVKKPVNEVVVPPTGGDPIPQDCEKTSGTLLKFETGSSAKVGCPFEGESKMEVVEQDQLPQALPFGPEFVGAISVDLTKDGEALENPAIEGKITLSFKIPTEMKNGKFSLLYWDPTAKDGAGDWVELPLDQFGGTEFPLNPDDPEDQRSIFSGLEIKGDTVTVTVNFPGVFALVAR